MHFEETNNTSKTAGEAQWRSTKVLRETERDRDGETETETDRQTDRDRQRLRQQETK